MNPKEFADKAITVEPLRGIPITEAGSVSLRLSSYPEPEFGVMLYQGKRGRVTGSIDWGVNHLRRGIANLIESVAEDCVSVVNGLEDVDDKTKERIAKAIRVYFEMLPH